MRYLLCAILVIVALLSPLISNASDTSLANYEATVTVSNNSTATTNVAVPFSLNSTALVAAGYIDTDCTRVAMTDMTDAAFMPGYGSNPWVVFVPSIGADATVRDSLYTSNTSMSSTKYYFPGSTGMAVADNAILEPSANFTLSLNDTFVNTSTSDYLVNKQSALNLSSGSGNLAATVYGSSSTITQTNTDDFYQVRSGYYVRIAQYYPSLPICNISSVTVYLAKNNSPTGTAYLRLRKASDDSIIGTWGSLDVSTLTASPAAKTFSTSTVYNTAAQNVYFSLEYSGGDVTNYLKAYYGTGELITGDIYVYQSSWTPTGVGDMSIVFTYNPIALSLSSAVETGEHDIVLSANSSNLTMAVDGVTVNSTALGGVSVPNNASNWQWGSTATLYISSCNMTVGGNLVGSWAWQYAATFTDLSGNGRTGTPTFRTTSTDADVSATISSFVALDTATAPSYTVTDQGLFYTANVTATGNFTSNTTSSGGPAAIGIVDDVSDAGGVPPPFLWGLIGCFAMSVVGLGLSYARRRYAIGGGYVFVMLIMGILIFGLLIAFKKFDWWMLWFYIIIAGGIAMASRHLDWGGSTSSHGLFGFLAMSWIGMTLINRILEGALLTAAETAHLNSVAFTKAFSLLNLFTIPIMNWEFFTVGIPSLLRWDYSFFGGQAQIVQYLLYSLTTPVAFIIFSVILGLVYSAITRST